MLVAARPSRGKRPSRKLERRLSPPEPTFAPVAEPQSLSTPEGEPVSVVLSGHLVNTSTGALGGPVLSFLIASTPAHGMLTGIPPYLVYTPASGFHGSDSFTFTADVGAHASTPATVSIAVAHVNRAPALTLPGEQMTSENTVLGFSSADADAISLSDEDSEGEAERLTLEVTHGSLELGSVGGLVSAEGQGSAKVLATGTLVALQQALELVSYTPVTDYQGSDSLKLEVDDLGHTGLGGAKTAMGSVPIFVTATVYDHAADDTFSTEENQTLTKNAGEGVLVNDSDSHALPLSAVLVKGPEHGTLTLNADGSLEYAPDHDFHGSDSFTYKDNDTNTDSNVATATITVTPVTYDHAANDSYSTEENAKLTKPAGEGVLANDTDNDTPSLPLSAVVVKDPEHGTVTLKADGSFEYAPSHNYAGTDTFTYKDEDGNGESNVATVTLSVGRVTYDHAVNDSYTAEENLTLTKSASEGVLANDTDSDTPPLPLGAAIVKDPLHGTVTLRSNGSFEYTPESNYTGSDSFTYKDEDTNSESNVATVTLTVNRVTYDHATDDSYAAEENADLTKPAGEGVLVNDTDTHVPPLPLSAVVVKDPVHGTVTLNADGSFEYVPDHNFHGSDSFTYKDEDGNSESNVATVTLTVGTVTYDHAVDDSYSAEENATLTELVGEGVLANDTDSDTPPLPLSAVVVKDPEHGMVTLNADGSFEYVPDHNYVGSDSFTYKDEDINGESNVATVTLSVNKAVFDHAVDDSYPVTENAALTKSADEGVLANDTDSDTPPLPLSAVVVKDPEHGMVTLNADGSFEYVPDHNFHGSDSFTYKDEDGNSESNVATVTLTVNTVTYDSAEGDSYIVDENSALIASTIEGVLANDTDSDTPPLPLSAMVVKDPEHGTVTLNADGSFEYVPDHNYVGSDSFTYKDEDGNSESNVATVTLDVTPVVYDTAADDSYTASENSTLTVPTGEGVLTNDTDSDTPPLPLSAVIVQNPAHGTVTLNPDGSFKYTPESNFTGSDSFTYKDEDGNAESNVATVTIEVQPHVNEAPTVSPPSAQELSENTTSEKTSLVFSVAKSDAVSVADADSEGGSEKVTVSVAHGTLVPGGTTGLSATGSGTATLTLEGTISALNAGLAGLTYTPTLDYHGSDSLSLEITDNGHSGNGGAKSDGGSVAITVAHPNPAPSNPTYSGAIGNTEFSVGVGGSGPDVQVSGSVLPETTEVDGSTLKATPGAISSEHGGSVSMSENGSFTYQPPAGYDNGADSFKYTETDSAGGKATGTATIKIANARVWYVNDAETPAGDGESNSPFKALSSIASASTGSGDAIFLYKGSATYTGGIELKSTQKLEGQSQGLTVEGHTLVSASGANPTITNATVGKPGVSLTSGDTVNGITVESAKGDGIQGSGVSGEVTITNDTISQSAEDGIDLSASSGTLTLDVAHDTLTREHDWAISSTSSVAGSTLLGTIDHNTIGERGVADSGGAEDGGIRVEASGAGATATVAVSENTVLQVHDGYGIWLRALQESATLNATVLKNDVEMLEEKSREALYVTSGERSTDATKLCLHAAGNTLKASGETEAELGFNAEAVLLEVKQSATFELQGSGGGASATQVAKLLEAENTLASPEPEPVFIEEQKSFTPFSGACPEP